MARHGGALGMKKNFPQKKKKWHSYIFKGFLQNNGLNYLHSLTFDRANITERRDLSER